MLNIYSLENDDVRQIISGVAEKTAYGIIIWKRNFVFGFWSIYQNLHLDYRYKGGEMAPTERLLTISSISEGRENVPVLISEINISQHKLIMASVKPEFQRLIIREEDKAVLASLRELKNKVI